MVLLNEATMWRAIEIVLIVLGLVIAYVGFKLNIPVLQDLGIASLGLLSIVIGWEAIITRRIVIGSRRHGSRRLYTGPAAMMQGAQFNILGYFLIVISILLFFNTDPRALGQQIARHLGWLLVMLGIVFLTQAAVVFIGKKLADNARWSVLLDLIVLRLLPGGILVVLGLGALGLGLFEIVAPNAFDAMGGGILEVLYGLR
jgi:hypothetical protein